MEQQETALDKSAIPVKDLIKMIKRKIPENSPPYLRSSLEYSHQLIDGYITDLIQPNAKGGKVNCNFAQAGWKVYQEGRETEIAHEMLDRIPKVSDDDFKFWKNVFEQPVDKMLLMGRTTLLFGFDVLNLWFRRWLLTQKYSQFFNSGDPNRWMDLRVDIDHFEANHQEFCPLDMAKCLEKIKYIMQGTIELK